MNEILLYNELDNSWVQILVDGEKVNMNTSPNAVGWATDTWKRYMGSRIPVAEVVASLVSHGFVVETPLNTNVVTHLISFLSATQAHALWKESRAAKFKVSVLKALNDVSLWDRWYRQDFGDPATYTHVFGNNIRRQYQWMHWINMLLAHALAKSLSNGLIKYSIVDINTMQVTHEPYMRKTAPMAQLCKHLGSPDNTPDLPFMLFFKEKIKDQLILEMPETDDWIHLYHNLLLESRDVYPELRRDIWKTLMVQTPEREFIDHNQSPPPINKDTLFV